MGRAISAVDPVYKVLNGFCTICPTWKSCSDSLWMTPGNTTLPCAQQRTQQSYATLPVIHCQRDLPSQASFLILLFPLACEQFFDPLVSGISLCGTAHIDAYDFMFILSLPDEHNTNLHTAFLSLKETRAGLKLIQSLSTLLF